MLSSSFAIDEMYFFIAGALFFLFFLIQRLLQYKKEKNKLYLLQALLMALSIVTIVFVALDQTVYALIVFVILVFASILVYLFQRKELKAQREQQLEKVKADAFDEFPGSLIKQGLGGQIAYFIIIFIGICVLLFILMLLFPALVDMGFAVILALIISIVYTRQEIEKLKKLEK
jgi:Flp pilus assembly protein TadB